MQPWRALRGLGIALLAVSMTWAAAPSYATPAISTFEHLQASADPSWQLRMLATVNRLRAQAGVAPLHLCRPLASAAADYARVMAARNHYGHRGPDGTEPWDRMSAKGYAWQSAAENIAAGYESVAGVMRAWRRSPEHLHNILDRGYEHVGFGRSSARGSRFGTYWVQDFGSGGSCRAPA